MQNMYQNNPRLCQLLDQLCEDTLSPEDSQELSALVKNDPVARDYYVRYLDLHTTLFWDVAVPVEHSSKKKELPLDEGRLKDLIGELVEDVSLPIDHLLAESVAHSVEQLQTRRQILTASNLRWSLSLVTALTLLVAMIWQINPLGGDSLEVAKNENSGPESVEDKKEETENEVKELSSSEDLPPRLPDIKWHHASGTPEKTSDHSEEKKGNPPTLVSSKILRDDHEIIEEINYQIADMWEQQEATPSPIAEDHEWIRRVYLDLAGRIPTQIEVQTFVQNPSQEKKEKLVNQLLDSPEFASQWSTRWTNLLVGRTPNSRVDRFQLQRYLRQSLVQSRPWSLVVSDLISAQGDPQENGAANFLVAHLNNQAVPATAFVSRTLLGTQIHCAQCHKHPFYATTQLEFWELNSFFKQAKVIQQKNEVDDQAGNNYVLTDQEFGGPTYFETRSGIMRVAYPKFDGQKVSEKKSVSRRKELAKLLVRGKDPLIARSFVNRTWSQFFGYGFTSPIDDLGPHNPASHPELFKTLSQSFVACDYDVKRLVRWICLSKPYHLSSRPSEGNLADQPDRGDLPVFSHMYYKPLSPEQLYDSLLTLSGQNPGSRRDWDLHLEQRENWVLQFVNSRDNDENDESNHFQGTITQALAMMNGDLVEQTITPEGKSLAKSLASQSISDLEKFEQVCLSILSRKPKQNEINFFRKMTRQLREAASPHERKQMLAHRLEDAMWAYLNSSEFIINH